MGSKLSVNARDQFNSSVLLLTSLLDSLAIDVDRGEQEDLFLLEFSSYA